MILDTPCALRSSSSTRSRNGRVPAFELLRRPTTRPSSVGTRLANRTAFSATPASGASNSIGGISGTLLPPRQQLRRRGLLEPLELGDEAFRAAEQAAEERAGFPDVADRECSMKGRCRC